MKGIPRSVRGRSRPDWFRAGRFIPLGTCAALALAAHTAAATAYMNASSSMRNTTGGELQTDQVRAVSAADYDRAGDGASADLDLYNLRGQRVRTLLRQVMPAGEHGIPWRGDDESGGAVASGTYVVRLLVNGHHVFRQRLAMVR